MSQAPEPGDREFLTLEDLFHGDDAAGVPPEPSAPPRDVRPDADPPVPELL